MENKRRVFDVFAPPGEAFVPEETLIERRRALEQLRVSTALQEAERAARLQAITRAAEREGQPSTEIYGHTSKLPPLQGRLSEIIEARTQTPARNVLDGVRIPSTLRPTMTPSVAPASQTPLGELITAATQARTQRDSAPAPTAPTRVPTLPAPIEHPPLIDTLRQAQRQTQREAGLVRDAATTLGIAPRGRAAEKPPVTQPPATKKPPTPKDGEMGWAEVAGRSLRAGITQASANIMGLLRMPGRGVAEVLDLILPEHIYDIKDDPFIQAGDRMMEFYDESVAKQDEKLKGLTGAKKYLDLGLRPLPQVILAAIPGVGKVKGAVAAGKAAAAAKPTVAGKVTAAARAAAKRAAADPPVDIARMLPFGTLAGSGAARQAELEGATYLQQVLTGIFVGGGEMAAESIPFNHALRVIRRLGVDELVERGSRSLIREFGAAGLDFLRAGATEALEESAMVPWDRFVRRSVYAPEIPVTGEGGIFDIAPIIEGGIGGLAMATVLGALGMPAASASYVLARRAFRERQNLNTLVKELEEIMPQEMAAIRQAQEQGISIEDIDAVTEEDIAEAETTVAATVEDIAETTAAETTAEETADIEAEAGAEVPVVAAEAPVPTIADAQEVMATEAPVVAAEEEMADMDDIDDIDDGQPHLPPPVQPPAQRTPAAVTPAFAKQVKVGDRVRTSFSGDTLEVVDTSVEFGEDAKALIRAYKSPNVAVMSHELGHIFRRDLSNSDLIVVEDWAGVSEGEWTTEAEEKFADGFVEYLSEGNAPTPQLRNVFEQFKEWLSNLFKGMTPVQKKTLSAPVRQVFDKLISGEAQPADKHANLTALWNNAKGDSFARKRLDFMQNLPENITRAEARRWLDQNADDRGTAPEQVTVEQRLEEVSVLHDPDADRRNAWVVGDIVLDRNDATTRRAMANLGMAAVPGLRLQDAETAGLVRLMVHKGIIPQSDWDEYVQGLVRSGSVRGAQAGTPTVTPAAATVATPAAATVATPAAATVAPTETPKKEVKESGRRTSETHDTGRLAGEGGGQALEGTPPTDVQGTGEVGDVGETGVRGTVEHTGRVVNVDKPGDELPQGVGGREGELAVPAGRKDDADTGRTDAPVGQRPGNVRVLDGKGTTAQNFRFTEEASAELENRSEQTKVRDNIAAVRLVKQIMNENRQASQAEQTVLSKYIGWGFKKNLFDSVKPKDDGFNEARKEIKELLTEKEWLDARQSALYAHYTSATVVRAMYDALESMGFHGGRVLEPAMGIGYFFGMMPQEMLRDSWITGVEIESMSGNIAKLLFPQGNMNVMGYQNFSVPHDETKLLQENYYDLVISNVPFSDTRPFTDPRYDKLLGARNLHNYFFAKAIDQVRPGGLLAFITSRYTMDGTSAGAVSFREHMDGKADFLGAVRLHNETFKKIAGTSVVADIIFMRKRAEGDSSQSEEWTKTIIQEFAVEGGRAGRISRQNVNEYFVNNPDMVLGDPKTTSAGMYGDETYTVDPTEATKDVRKSLTKALKKLPKGIYRLPPKHAATEAATAEDLLPADYGTFPGTYIVKNKKLMFTTVNEAGELVLSPASKAMKVKPGGIVEKRILGMLGVRDVHAELTKLELTDANEQKINDARKRLNDVCDAFVKEFGYITSKANSMAFSIDQSYYKIAALEMVDKENNIVEKADMFRKRTISRFVPATSAETATEALAISLNERGRVDFEHMSRLTKKTQGELQRELAGLVYNDPEVGWTTADEYLSGNVREKLRIAEDAAKHDNAFTANVTALKDVQPIDLMPEEIPVTLGIPWIPISDVEAFLEHLFEASPRTFRLTRSLLTNLWVLEFSHKHVSYRVERSPVNNLVWGIPNFTALDIIRKSFNNEAIEVATNVRDEDGKTRRVVDKLKTVAAKEKQAAILKEFERWIWQENPARAKRLAAKYNNEYNNLRLRVYDGEHLTFPGMNPNITLEKHQKRAVWRILQGRSTLLAHTVGAGKTFEMVAAAMEMKRLGIARKTLLVSPNNLVAQNALEAQKLYPAANILFFSPEDMNKQNRKITTARIATGDWDLIIMPESSFGKLPMSAEYVESTIKDELNKIDKSIEELGNLSKSTARDVAKSRNALERKLREQTKKLKKEQDLGFMTFQETGIDALFVDESHNYKNLFYSTRMARIGSLGTQEGSMKAFDMLTKVNYLRSMHNGRGIVFASGTPISNTMAELYHLQRYLDPQALADRDIHSFDAWAQTFGRVVTSLELNPSGKGFRQKQRFAKFVNVAELLQMYRSFADILTHEMLVEILGDAVQLPKIAGGGAILQTAMPSAEVLAYIEELTARADDIRAGNVDAKRDNYLKIVGDGRLVALYPPLRGLPDYQGSKVDIVANNVFEIWENGKSEKLTQLLFLDLSTPKGKTKAQLHEEETGEDMEEEWDETKSTVYNVIRQRLINKGIPAKEIAFIHDYKTDAQKLALYDAMNAGSVRILMGSTAKMGVGMNVQKRLFALHHVDAPWRPSDVLQRVGRIVRRGNTNEEVYVFAYGTESTLDSLIWQILETKQRFIAQLERQNLAVRTMEDVDEMSLSFGQIKAALTGDETIITLAHLQQELTTLLAQEQAHRGSKLYAINAARHYEAELASENATIASYEESLKMRTETKGDNFTIELEGKAYDKRADAKAAFDALAQDVAALAKQGGAEFIPRVAALRARGFTVDSDGLTAKGGAQANVKVGKFAGGDLWFSLSDASLMAYVKLGGYHWAESSLASVEHVINGIESKLANLRRAAEEAEEKALKYTQLAREEEFPQSERLRAVKEQIATLEHLLQMDETEVVVISEGEDADADDDDGEVPFMGIPKKKWKPQSTAQRQARATTPSLALIPVEPETAVAAVTAPADPQPAKRTRQEIIRRRETILKLMDILDTPLRTGKIRKRGVLGVFKIHEELIRTKSAHAEDPRVVFHEAGHRVDKLFDYELTSTDRFDNELLETEYVLALKEKFPKMGDKELREEGFAEFFYFFLSKADEAKDKFPNFYDYFIEQLQTEPDLFAKLQDYQQLYEAYDSQDPVSKVLAAVGEPRKQRTSFRRAMMQVLSRVFDDLHPWQFFTKIMTGGRALPVDVDPYSLARLSRGSAGRALVLLRHGQYRWIPLAEGESAKGKVTEGKGANTVVFTKVGPSLKEIAESAGDEYVEFTAYLMALRARELEAIDLPAIQKKAESLGLGLLPELRKTLRTLEQQNKKETQEYKDLEKQIHVLGAYELRIKTLTELKEREIVSGMDIPAAEEVYQMYKDNKKFNDLQKQLRGWWAFIVQDSVDAGVISAASARTMEEMHWYYVPFKRVRDADERSSSGTSEAYGDLPSPVKRIYGGMRSIRDIWEQAGRDAYFFTAINDKNRALLAFADLANANEGMGAIMEKLPPPLRVTKIQLTEIKDTLDAAGLDTDIGNMSLMATVFSAGRWGNSKENTIVALRGGNPEFWRLDPDLYNSIMAYDKETVSMIAKLLRPFAQMMRTSAVLSPRFQATNPWRDQFWTAVTEPSFVPFIDLGKGIASIAGKDDWYLAFMHSGGAYSALANYDEYKHPAFTLRMKDKIKKYAVNFVTLQPLRGVASAIEESTKVSIFRRKLQAGATRRQAAFAARNAPVDFSVSGSGAKTWRAITPFFSAALTSNFKLATVFMQNPLKMLLRGVLFITLPTILLWLFNKDNPFYEELPNWRKDGFWHFPNLLGPRSNEGHAKTFIAMPIPHLAGFGFKVLTERILRAIYNDDHYAFEGVQDTFIGLVRPNMVPPAILPHIENWANIDTFTGRPIVPMREQMLAPNLQYGPHTTESAKLLGRAFGVSPRQVDNVINGLLPGLGALGIRGVDAVLEATGVADPVPRAAGGLRGLPILGEFISAPGMGGSATMDAFFMDYDTAQRVDRTDKAAVAQGEPLPPISEKEAFLLTQLPNMRRVDTMLGNIRKQVREIHADLNMSPNEKRRQIDILDLAMINLVRETYGKLPLPE